MKRCFTSVQSVVGRLKPPLGTSFAPIGDGKVLAVSPLGVEYKLTYKPGVGIILTEDSFVELALARKLGVKEMCLLTGRKICLRSRKVYGKKYSSKLKELCSARLARSQKGNKNGRRLPSVVIPKDELEKLVMAGQSLTLIARKFGTTEFIVQRNIDLAGLQRIGSAPLWARSLTEERIAQIDKMCPGLKDAFHTFSVDKPTFYMKAYQSFLQLLEMAWFLKDACSIPFLRYRHKNGGLDEISWTMNRYEVYLAQELMAAGVPFVREFVFHGAKRADFAVVGTNILVEIDGQYHTPLENAKRDQLTASLGYQTVRVSLKEAAESTLEVVKKIQDLAQTPSARSGQLVCRRSGT